MLDCRLGLYRCSISIVPHETVRILCVDAHGFARRPSCHLLQGECGLQHCREGLVVLCVVLRFSDSRPARIQPHSVRVDVPDSKEGLQGVVRHVSDGGVLQRVGVFHVRGDQAALV